MRLENIINTARNGELKSLSAKDKTNDVVIDYINTAVTALYNRFTLRTVTATITPTNGNTVFILSRSCRDSSTSDVLVDYGRREFNKVISIVDNLGNKYSINNDNDIATIMMPSYDTVVIPSLDNLPAEFVNFIVVIGVVPLEIPLDADLGTRVDVPRFLLEAMLHYIGYRAHGSVDGNIDGENNTHLMRFVAACNSVEELGLVPTDNTVRNVTTKGFI